MPESKKTYFISDVHLGAPDYESSLVREKHLVQWFDEKKQDAEAFYIVGDLFDFWFEYKHSVPKGYVRILGKLAEISDSGIPIYFFTGNHDMWVFDYLPKELGFEIYKKPIERELNGKKFLIGHGDGLGPGDHSYKFLKKIFSSKVCQWLFGWVHPNVGIGIASFWSKRSRIATGGYDKKYQGDDNEWLVSYCKRKIQQQHFDYFVFGHRHLPIDLMIGETSRYINLGDWIVDFTFAEFDGEKLHLREYRKPNE